MELVFAIMYFIIFVLFMSVPFFPYIRLTITACPTVCTFSTGAVLMRLTLRRFVFHVCACMFCLIVYGLIL